MRVIDTTGEMNICFASGQFRLEDWEKYIDASLPGAKELCLSDMRECVAAGYPWESDFLPVLNGVMKDARKREEAIKNFHAVADDFDERLKKRFGRTVDADLVLYLGLCNGAGWVTGINGTDTVLFGIEKTVCISIT